MRNRFRQIAVVLFFSICFLLVSHVFDVVPKSFKIPVVLLALLGISLAASGRGFVFWQTTAGKIMPVFVAWVLLTWLLAGHTMDGRYYMQAFVVGAVLFAAAAGLLNTAADFSKLFMTLACAGVVAALLGVVWSGQHYGRFALRMGAYADPNYYAMGLLAVMPLMWTTVARKALWVRIAGLLAMALPLLLLVKTGSRAAVISIVVMLVVLFLLSSLTARIVIGGLAAVAVVALLAFVPNVLKSRLAPSDAQSAEQNSSAARQTLLVTGLVMTLNNPLLGLGPGNFARAIVDEGRMRGEEYAPLGTHNAYTQISSETGVPGIILFLLLIGFSIVKLVSLLRQTSANDELHELARGMLLSLAGVCIFLFFLSEGYNPLVYLWLGLATGLRRLLPEPEREIEEYEEIVS